MATRKVTWTEHALAQREEILEYWIERNGSTTHATKLLEGFESHAGRLAGYLFIGIHTNTEDVHITFFNEYSIYYHVGVTEVLVLAVRDNRRNPIQRPF